MLLMAICRTLPGDYDNFAAVLGGRESETEEVEMLKREYEEQQKQEESEDSQILKKY